MHGLSTCSSSQGKPIICVSINYRVGIFGFLASEKGGISGNFGLKDQVCAFQWIKQHIEGFGGCPDSVTAFGESAGAISLSTLLATTEPLFSRVILMSGDVSLRRPRTVAWQEAMLCENLQYLGLGDLQLSDAIEKLRAIPAAEIVQIISLVQHWSPTLDDGFLTGFRERDFYIENSWCQHVMMGDMAHDGTILRSRYLDIPQAFEKTILACDDLLEASQSRQIQEAYGLGADEKQPAAARGLRFPGSVRVQEYHMDQSVAPTCVNCDRQTNPFEGNYHGFASHALDLGYLLRNFDPWLSEAGLNFGKRMLGIWVGFAYAEDSRSEALALGPDHEIIYSSPEKYDQRNRQGRAKLLLEIGLAKSVVLGERLQGVPNPTL
ncbi:Alpha/Beta hydrolase protein [Boeremia exigua]|uniref:Alpha/Beta hydrolase protein n=1 Tax=Boeremia exigua TaxID=749465 RepID=UPI001E8D8B73|nr:Alpha/Beta hydrolase protein [Boeremia exigua]KAH6615186.1 Alpha/Beta hydrolase protein [Boeremia exigua]